MDDPVVVLRSPIPPISADWLDDLSYGKVIGMPDGKSARWEPTGIYWDSKNVKFVLHDHYSVKEHEVRLGFRGSQYNYATLPIPFHMEFVMTNQSDNNTSQTDADNIRAAATCLLDYLKTYGKASRPFDVLQFLAQETLSHLDEGREPKFKNSAIKNSVAGKAETDPSAWLSPIWNKLNTEIRQEREEGLQKFAADRGLKFYPWVGKLESSGGAGNQALHFLEALPIPLQKAGRVSTINLPKPDISYIPAENLKPSWWARRLFDRNHVASGWRKWLLVWPSLLWIVMVGLSGFILFLGLTQIATPVTTRDLMAIIILALMAWYVARLIKRLEYLVDDRLVMVSDQMVGFGEFGVCMEFFKVENADIDTPSSLRMVKYAAQCPICLAQVLLNSGEPDFPRRIIGRCQESPREHVFSFDRVTRNGYRLR